MAVQKTLNFHVLRAIFRIYIKQYGNYIVINYSKLTCVRIVISFFKQR